MQLSPASLGITNPRRTGGGGGGGGVPGADPNFANVSLLLHGDGANASTTFKDNSRNNFAVSVGGGAKLSTTQFKFGSASMSFSALGDYLTVANNTAFDLSGDFTIEAWIYPNGANTGSAICIKRTSNIVAAAYNMGIGQSGGSYYLGFSGSTNGFSWNVNPSFTNGTQAMAPNSWHHVAACKSGTTITTYVNGVADLVLTGIGNLATTADNLTIGANDTTGGSYFPGYIDDFRITKGVARYTGNFTVPTAPFGNGATDPQYTNVTLLLHGEGANGSTTFTDNSLVPQTPTVNGTAQISTAQAKFGSSSMYLDGLNGNFLSYNRLIFDFGLTTDFTIEFWFYPISYNTYDQLIGMWGLPYNAWQFSWYPTYLGVNGNYSTFTRANAPLNTWHHLALCRSGTTMTVFLNGVPSVLGANVDTTTISGGTFGVGRVSNQAGLGAQAYYDDFRVTRGVARYSGAFTPPTAAFPDN